MTTINPETTNELEAAFNSLKNDLCYCWETRFFRIEAGILGDTQMNRMSASMNYTHCIDPENMFVLELLVSKSGNGESSFNSISHDVREMSFDSFCVKHFGASF